MWQRLLFPALCIFMFLVNGQEQSVFSGLVGPRENIHLHLNKTAFLQGERLWFKAYIRDQNTKRPSLETTNLHVGIYGDDGEEVKRKLFYVENGVAQGDFGIDSTLVDSEYTVLAWTNYMRNFKELEPFRQQIRILRDGPEEETGDVDMKISVYPEGGQLIAGAHNNMGVLVDNGLGQGVKVDNLELVDGTGKIIRSNIKTNLFGMGKIGFLVENRKKYFLQRQRPDGSLVRTRIPEAVEGQLGLNIDNNGKDKVLLTLLASKETFSKNDGDIHTVALYQDDFIRLEELEINEGEPVLSMDRKELPFGVLTAVLFDMELRPIAHRIFFNYGGDNPIIQQLEVEHCLTEFGDSLQVDLILPKGMKGDTNISLSALPNGTDAYSPDHSIVSSFLIGPYIKHYFQDHYYFEGQDRKKRYELDKRLIIEGWGRFDWDSRRHKEMQLAFEMENGIPFRGKVIDADLNEEKQISLVAELSGEMDFRELENDKSFRGNMLLYEGDSLGISIIGKKGELRKPKAELSFGNQEKTISGAMEWSKIETIKRQQNKTNELPIDVPLGIREGIIALEEVTVTESVYKIKKIEMFVLNFGRSGTIAEGVEVGPSEIKRYNTIMSFLAKYGYKRTRIKDSEGFWVDAIRGPKNDIISFDFNIELPLSWVDAVYFDISKRSFLSIRLRNDIYVDPEKRNKFIKFAIENGYAQPQDFFKPNYSDYSSQIFRSFGTLDWRTNILVGSELPTTITIPINAQREVVLHLEGMAEGGQLVALSKVLPTVAPQ